MLVSYIYIFLCVCVFADNMEAVAVLGGGRGGQCPHNCESGPPERGVCIITPVGHYDRPPPAGPTLGPPLKLV